MKAIQFTIIILLFCTFSGLYAGNTGKIAGVVLDQRTGEPLAGANVIVISRWENDNEIPLDIPAGASTDLEGTYFILNLRPGAYNVKATYIGYTDMLKTRVTVFVDKTTEINYEMKEQLLETEEIVVTAYTQETVEKDLTATKQVYNVSEVQSIAGVADLTDILELQADVVDDHFRGGRIGESTYLMAGSAIVNPLDNSRAFNPIVTGLEQVEVYTSGFSAEYGNAQSGVVNMITKEGTSVWQSRAEVSGTLPYYKSWGGEAGSVAAGSPYDPANLIFAGLLMNPEEWLEENPLDPGKPLWDRGYGVTKYLPPPPITWPPSPPLTREDSLVIANLGRLMWMQSVRELGMEYDNTVDYRVDFTTGGPIAKNTNIFMAVRQNVVYPEVPMTQPDMQRQLMSNLTFNPNPNHKFKLSVVYDYDFENVLDSNWWRWLFDRTFSVIKRTNRAWQGSLEYKYVFTPSTYADFTFSILNTREEDRIDLLKDDQVLEDYSNGSNWVDYTGPSNHRVGRLSDDRGDRKTMTYYTSGSLISQIDRYNLLKTGLQLYFYNLDVKYQNNVTGPSSIQDLIFTANPFEGALYLQDKMEYEGMIANIGLRFDFYQLNTTYYTDKFNPLLDPDAVADTKLYTRLQPRVGFSFPVSELTVFHLNYGTFTQRPNFNQLYYNQINVDEGAVSILTLGNPELKPENTKSYDIGIVHKLAAGLQLDVSAYYKDVKDLIQSAYYQNTSGTTYATYVNLDYADIKGFHVSLERNIGSIRGYIRYNYESATGKSANADNLDVAPIYTESGNTEDEGLSGRFPEDVYLDYDRTHKAVFNLRYLTPRGSDIFSNISVSLTYRYTTGRPYTWDESGQGLKYNQRTPNENELRMRIEKGFDIGKTNMTLYFEGFNLLNEFTYSYSRTFNNDRNVVRWSTLDNQQDILVEDFYAPYVTRQDIYLLANQPRHYRMGVIFKF